MFHKLYIIDTNKPFSGSVENTITRPPFVDYTDGEKWGEYKEGKEQNDTALNLELFTYTQLKPMIDNYHNRLITQWAEVTEGRYSYGLECMPPLKWHSLKGGISIFYICEAYTDNIHTAYIQANDGIKTKYYSAMRRLSETDESLLNSFLTSVESIKTNSKYLCDYEESTNKAIAVDANKISDWSFSQKWSDDEHNQIANKYESMVIDFENKHNIRVKRK